jgi:hypothetical protein
MKQNDLEKSLLSYLTIHGNTKVSDLIEFGTTFSGIGKEEVMRILDNMIAIGSVRRIIHYFIESSPFYIAKVNWSLGSSVESAASDLKNKERLLQEAKRIKEEAKIIAERRINDCKISQRKDNKDL